MVSLSWNIASCHLHWLIEAQTGENWVGAWIGLGVNKEEGKPEQVEEGPDPPGGLVSEYFSGFIFIQGNKGKEMMARCFLSQTTALGLELPLEGC